MNSSNRSFIKGFENYKLWWRLAMTELSIMYRRSILGLLWIIISFMMFIGVKIFIFGSIMNTDPILYSIWVTSGYALWLLIQNTVMDGANVFVAAKPWILGTRLPYGTFVAQNVARHFVNFSLISIVVIALLIAYKWNINMTILTSFLGLVVFIITSIWAHILFGITCAHNRDLMYLVRAIMHVMFFVTPILYMPDQLGDKAGFLNYNPFTHYLAIVRDPIAFGTIPYNSWIIVGGMTAVGFLAAFIAARTMGRKLAFWV